MSKQTNRAKKKSGGISQGKTRSPIPGIYPKATTANVAKIGNRAFSPKKMIYSKNVKPI